MNDTLESIRTRAVALGSADARKNLPSVPLLAAAAGTVGGEALLATGTLGPALTAHALAVLCCLFAVRWAERDRAALTAFALVPLFRLVNLGMPRAFVSTVPWLVLVYLALVPGVYYVARTPGTVVPSTRLGLLPIWLPPAVALGALAGELEHRVVEPAALAPDTLAGLAVLTVGMVLVVAPVEEVVFRGLLQGTLMERFGRGPGLVAAALVYGVGYLPVSPAAAAFAAGFGFVLGVLYERTRSIVFVALIHGVANVYLYGYRPANAVSLTGLF
jgi:membrane protease YdiL (CAAX protease family)